MSPTRYRTPSAQPLARFSILMLLAHLALPALAADQGCGPECHGSCFGGVCLFLSDPENEDAPRRVPPVGEDANPTLAAAAAAASLPVAAPAAAAGLSARSSASVEQVAKAVKSVEEELRHFVAAAPDAALPAAAPTQAGEDAAPRSPDPAPDQGGHGAAAARQEALVMAQAAPWHPDVVQPLLRGDRREAAKGGELEDTKAASDLATLAWENRHLRENLKAAKLSEAQLSTQVGSLKAKLSLWERAGRRVAEREGQIVDFLSRAGIQAPGIAAPM